MHIDGSLVGPLSLPHPVLSQPPPTTTVDSASSFMLGSHPILKQAKDGILKICHLANLAVLGSSRSLSTLIASTKSKGFKYATKNPTWLMVVDEEV